MKTLHETDHYIFRGIDCWCDYDVFDGQLHFDFGDFVDVAGDEFFYHCTLDSDGFWSCKWYEHDKTNSDFTDEEYSEIVNKMETLAYEMGVTF